MSTIAHPGRVPARRPSPKTVTSVVVGLVLAMALGSLALLDESANQTASVATSQRKDARHPGGGGRSAEFTQQAEVAEVGVIKELTRSMAIVPDIWQSNVDFLTEQYAARNPGDQQGGLESDYLSSGFDLNAGAETPSAKEADAWSSKVDFMTEQYGAQHPAGS